MDTVGDIISGLLILAFLFGFIGFWIWSLFWVYQDAQKRRNMGCLICILVFLTWPLGLLVWVLLRPKADYYQ